ncbi:hypothetical protein LINPERPRIM_LOCUS5177 [Linum perenne]
MPQNQFPLSTLQALSFFGSRRRNPICKLSHCSTKSRYLQLLVVDFAGCCSYLEAGHRCCIDTLSR